MKNTVIHCLVVLILVSVLGCSDFFNPKKETVLPTNGPEGQSVDVLTEEYLNPNQGSFTVKKMLANLGLNIFLKNSEKFQVSLLRLQDSLDSYCEDLSSSPDGIRSDWKAVVKALHAIEAVPFGPYTANSRQISDYTYSWPIVNFCSIDQTVFKHAKNEKIDIANLLLNQRGLGSVEYLLFESKLLSRCNKRGYPEMVQWESQPENKRKLDRCLWSKKLVQDVFVKSEKLRESWSVTGQNFTARLVYDKAYRNEKESLNALTDSMASLEYLKDLRLGRPLGRHKDCGAEKCPQDIEHIFSGLSFEAIETQLKTVRAVFTGSEKSDEVAFGFDDLLEKSGHSDVSVRFVAAVDQSLQTLQQVKTLGSLQEQIEQFDPAQCRGTSLSQRLVPVCGLHADVREVALLLKTEVLTALSLRTPPTHQGDND